MRLFNDKLSQYIWYLFTETQYEVQRNVNGVKDRAETLRVAKFAVLYKENQKAWKTTAGN